MTRVIERGNPPVISTRANYGYPSVFSGQPLYAWQRYGWANYSSAQNAIEAQAPAPVDIQFTTAVLSAHYQGQGARVRLVYGLRPERYDCQTHVEIQAGQPETVNFQLLELVPDTTYYVRAIAEPFGPWPGKTQFMTGAHVISPEMSFTTLVV